MIKINLLPARPRRRFAIALPTLPGLGLLFGVIYVVVIVLIGGYWGLLIREGNSLSAEIDRLEA